jgi:hypothetical protein
LPTRWTANDRRWRSPGSKAWARVREALEVARPLAAIAAVFALWAGYTVGAAALLVHVPPWSRATQEIVAPAVLTPNQVERQRLAAFVRLMRAGDRRRALAYVSPAYRAQFDRHAPWMSLIPWGPAKGTLRLERAKEPHHWYASDDGASFDVWMLRGRVDYWMGAGVTLVPSAG